MGNEALINDLETLPDLIHAQQLKWETLAANRKHEMGRKSAEIRLKNPGITSSEVKEQIDADLELYQMKLSEIVEKAEYERLLQNLLSAKKLASLRTAF